MKNKRYFPMFIDLSDKKIVVVGGGNIATRRIRTLLQFTRNITAGEAYRFCDGIYGDRSYKRLEIKR